MDKLMTYSNIIKKILTDYAEIINRNPTDGIMIQVVFDETHGHYMLLNIGWFGHERINGMVVYLQLRNNKIYVEEDGLENGIVDDLLQAGIPQTDIVLAFHHPEMRPYTEFAVA